MGSASIAVPRAGAFCLLPAPANGAAVQAAGLRTTAGRLLLSIHRQHSQCRPRAPAARSCSAATQPQLRSAAVAPAPNGQRWRRSKRSKWAVIDAQHACTCQLWQCTQKQAGSAKPLAQRLAYCSTLSVSGPLRWSSIMTPWRDAANASQ